MATWRISIFTFLLGKAGRSEAWDLPGSEDE
jgi:hypothetical protein